jgi:hypothetical protein
LVVIFTIFVTKFAVGAMLAMQPFVAHDPRFAAVIGLIYGGLSGMFFSRAVAMWKTAHRALSAVA